MYIVVSTVKAVEKSAPGLCGVSSGLLISCGHRQCCSEGCSGRSPGESKRLIKGQMHLSGREKLRAYTDVVFLKFAANLNDLDS